MQANKYLKELIVTEVKKRQKIHSCDVHGHINAMGPAGDIFSIELYSTNLLH